jgi:hypothetical protein
VDVGLALLLALQSDVEADEMDVVPGEELERQI